VLVVEAGNKGGVGTVGSDRLEGITDVAQQSRNMLEGVT